MLKLHFIKAKSIKFAIIITIILLISGIIFYKFEEKNITYHLSIEFMKNNKDIPTYIGEIKNYNFEKIGRKGWKFEKRYYHIYLNGAKDRGMLYIFFDNVSGEWKISSAELLLSGGRLIHLEPKIQE